MIVEGIEIKGITCDYERVKPGYAYVSLKEIDENSSHEIQEAIIRGAILIYTENAYDTDWNIPMKQVKNGRVLLSNLCNSFYNYPSEKIKLVGICGSNGKTTTSKMLTHILQSHSRRVAYLDILEEIEKKRIEGKKEDYFIEDYYFALDKLVKNNIEIGILELPSSVEIYDLLCGFPLDMLIYTTLGLEEKDIDVSSPKKALELLPSGGIVLLNMDDKESGSLLRGLKNKMVITYGLCPRATITSSSIDTTETFNCCLQRSITTKNGFEIEPMEMIIPSKVLGRHNVYNALAAVSAALIYDVSPEGIMKAFKDFQGVQRRMEIINHPHFTVVDDYSHNPIGYEAVFEGIQGMNYNNLYIINAIRGGKGLELNRSNAEILSHWFKVIQPKGLITTCSTDTVDQHYSVLEEEKNVYFHTLKENQIDFSHEDELQNALKIALETVSNNDLILLLGAQGMDQGTNLISKLVKKEKF